MTQHTQAVQTNRQPNIPSRTEPKTLLQWAGVGDQPIVWPDAVVVLIDIQQEYVTGALSLGEDGIRAIGVARQIVALARSRGVPIIHVAHHARPGGAVFNPDSELVRIVPEVAPQGDERVIIKTLPNAFANTTLADDIRAMGRHKLVVAGFMSHMCVSSTVRAAVDQGFFSFVCAEACATRALPSPSGVIAAEVLHDAAMAAMADRFAALVSLADLKNTAA